jgi:uncharacterized protein YggE
MKTLLILFGLITIVIAQVNFENTISVEGTGKIEVSPNMAIFTVEASITNNNYDSSLYKLDQVVNVMFPIFDKYKLLKEDYVIMPLSISEDIDYLERKKVMNGYKATKGIQIKYKDLPTLSSFAKDLITNNGISISRMNFSHTKIDSLKSIALKKAMDNAKNKATIICKYNNIELGKPLHFSTTKARYYYDTDDYSESNYGVNDLIGSLMGESGGIEGQGSQTAVSASAQLFKIEPGALNIKDKILVIYQINNKKQ